MSVSEQETRTSDVRLPEAELCARTILDSLPDQPAVASARLEGLEICSILGPLDLPPVLNAAVQLYPAAREGWIETKKLQVTSVPELGSLVEGLVQLGSFALPENWQPGEALATQQSETLRKMLLAVVSDARLVVARIGEQLYRLRRSKDASASQQRAIAVETQEIYAPLANRLGIWQLKWELEDLAFRFLHQLHRASRSKNSVDVLEVRSVQSLSHGRIRHQDNIVLIVANHVRPLRFEHADHLEWNVANSNGLAERVACLKQTLHHGVSQHTNLRC